MNIFLVGFMGAGKSSVGKKLSEEMNYKFIDTDSFIEKQTDRKIEDFFDKGEEEIFRKKEREFLQNFDSENTVISTGGGMACNMENISLMKKKGVIVYLFITLREAIKRTHFDRPLLKNRENIDSLFKKRLHFYRNANIIISIDKKTVEEVSKRIKALLCYITPKGGC
ncbi:MAG: shikimate kinase [Deltaproteobacteria bacterium]|nr:shikimate kinase [Deltaproteobacteria bacterium]